MTSAVRQRFEAYCSAPLTWRFGDKGKPAAVAWSDEICKDLGADPDGRRFREIGNRMLSGRYYPPDAIESYGRWMDEDREIRVGDRVLQRARVLPCLAWPALWAMTEVFVAERNNQLCTLGYVTTSRHFGRGIWQATLKHTPERLTLTVTSLAGPQSWLFWLGLPVARYLQQRAWRRAFEEFRRV